MSYSIWKKIRLIIIAFKYGSNNKQDLIAQIKAAKIQGYNIPQLSTYFYYFIINTYNTN